MAAVLIVYQDEDQSRDERNPYGTPAMSGRLEVADETLAHLTLMSDTMYSSMKAHDIVNATNDRRKGFIAGALSQALQHRNEVKPFTTIIKAMLQYQIASSRAVLAEHQVPSEKLYFRKNDIAASKVPSLSWQVLQRVLVDLEQQQMLLARLNTRATSSAWDKDEIQLALLEFDYVLKEMKCVLNARRERLDHELNETLLRESRANLKIAQQAMKDTQQNGLCEYNYIPAPSMHKLTPHCSNIPRIHLRPLLPRNLNIRHEHPRTQPKRTVHQSIPSNRLRPLRHFHPPIRSSDRSQHRAT